MLTETFLKLKQQTNSLTHNPLLDSFDQSALEKIDAFSEMDGFVCEKKTRILALIKGVGIDFNEKLKPAFDEYSEALTYLILKASFGQVERIPESDRKTPDFKISFEFEDGLTPINCSVYAELKTFAFAEGNLNYKDVMNQGLNAQIDIERQLNQGNHIAFGITEIDSLRLHNKDYDPYSIRQSIETFIKKAEQNIKSEQFEMGDTVLIINLKQHSLPGNYKEISVPIFQESRFKSLMSGLLWNMAFGKSGHLIFKPIEFEGRKNTDGELTMDGILVNRHWLKAVCFLTYTLGGTEPKIVGLHNRKGLTDSVEVFLSRFCDFVNDDENTEGWSLYLDNE